MIESVITALIYICLLVLCIYLIFWVLDAIGLSIPDQVKKIILVIAVLLAVLVVIRILLPGMGLHRIGSSEMSQMVPGLEYRCTLS